MASTRRSATVTPSTWPRERLRVSGGSQGGFTTYEPHRHLDLDKQRRHQLTQRLYAKPKHASALEEAFRRLGFHARSAERSGAAAKSIQDEPSQDTKSKNASMRWDQAISLALEDPSKARKDEKPIAEIPEERPQTSRSVPDDFKEEDRGATSRSVRFAGSLKSRDSRSRYSSLSSRGSSRGSYYDEVSEPTSRASSSNMGRSGTTRPSVGVEYRVLERRNSESDMRVDTPQQDVHKLAHDIATAPRRQLQEFEPIRQDRRMRPWLCPHPGCGAVFSTKEAAVQHAKTEHLGRRRLAVATPEQDQFFRRVWPEEKMIWERGEIAKKDREKCLFQCPICFQPCVTHDDLKRHLKVGHTKREVKKIYVELKLAAKADAMEQGKGKGLADVKGRAQLTPPFPPPKRAPLAVCLKHKRPRFRCWDCGCARRMKGPVAPMKFYPEVVVKAPSATVPGERPVITDMTFAVQSERCPYTIGDKGERRPCQLIATCRDEETDVWICVAYFLDAEAVKAMKGVTHRLFDHERELYEDSRVTWLRAEKLAGYCYVLNVDKREFYERKRGHLLPNHPRDYVYFASRIFDFEKLKAGPHRQLNSEVSAKDLGLTQEAYGVDDGSVVTWSTEPPKFKRRFSKDGESNPYAIKSRPGSTEVSLLTHDEEEESFKPTDAGMAAALGFMV